MLLNVETEVCFRIQSSTDWTYDEQDRNV